MKIAFLPTGRTEWNGLRGAFESLFPGHQVDVLPDARVIASFPDKYPFPGFTSNPLSNRDEVSPPGAAVELVAHAAQAALGDLDTEAADLVVVLDDVEPANAHQPEMVTRVFRAAVLKHLESLENKKERVKARTRDCLLTRVSFHLLVPMVEALFFADPNALTNAGVHRDTTVHFAPTCDPEDFSTNDTQYLGATEAACPCWSKLPTSRKKKLRPKWLGLPSWPFPPGQTSLAEPDRQVEWRKRHPKGYLQWLCRDGERNNCTRYDETNDGGAALAKLAWKTALSRPSHHFRYLRALLADVANALGQDPKGVTLEGDLAHATSPFEPRDQRVLRNL